MCVKACIMVCVKKYVIVKIGGGGECEVVFEGAGV